MLLARDVSGDIVPIVLEELFPGDFEANPDYRRLLRYTDVAVEETFVAFHYPDFVDSGLPWNFEGYCFECPPLRNAHACVNFPLEKVRFWQQDTAWDGITRVEDALASGQLSSEVWSGLFPLVHTELRLRAVKHCLDAIPEIDDLMAVARRYYQEHFSVA